MHIEFLYSPALREKRTNKEGFMKKTLKKIAFVLLVLMLAGAVTGCLEMLQMTVDVSNAVSEVNTAKSLYQTALKNDDADTF